MKPQALLPIAAAIIFLLGGCAQNMQAVAPAPDDTSQSSFDPTLSGASGSGEKPKPAGTVEAGASSDIISQEAPQPARLPASKIHSKPAPSAKRIVSLLDEALEFCEISQDFWQKGELEGAIDALDQAYALILKADTVVEPKVMQQKEDLRFMISKRILEIYASRNIVVNGHHDAIPLTINKHVQAEIDRFTTGRERKFFIRAYQRSGRFRAHIVEKLQKAGLPEELSWLPLIESGFKVNALSRARALGLWQFISSTGYKFGLKRNRFVDERLDPAKSTRAAIAYLKELHQIFGDWTTVLAAYNCGEGRVLRVIRSQNVNYLDNFWDLYERLPRETARYVPRFLATLHIVKHSQKYGLDKIELEQPLSYETVTVARQVKLKSIASRIGVSENQLRLLNPELRHQILPPEQYTLKVPPEKGEILLANLSKISVSSPPGPSYVYHRVRRGESLSTIAERYKTTVSRIARANRINRHHYIVAGKRLRIPLSGRYAAQVRKARHSNKRAIPSAHVVKRGDSLWNLARRYGTTTKNIQALNGLTTTRLYIGQVLKLSPSSSKAYRKYRVKKGDSPFRIARRNNMPLKRLLRINRLKPGTLIYPGQTLFLE